LQNSEYTKRQRNVHFKWYVNHISIAIFKIPEGWEDDELMGASVLWLKETWYTQLER